VSENEFPLHEEEEVGIPFDASPDQAVDAHAVHDDSLLSPDATTLDGKRKSMGIDGLELSVDSIVHGTGTTLDGDTPDNANDNVTPKKTKRKMRTGPKRNRKRRRIDVDNDQSELSSGFIKDMLRDTSDIVQQNRVHPADYVDVDDLNIEGDSSTIASGYTSKSGSKKALPPYLLPRRERVRDYPVTREIAALSVEELLMRPTFADGGGVAPRFLKLWENNSARIVGKPFPYKMRGKAGEEQRRQRAEDMMHSSAKREADADAEEEDIEIGRRNDESLPGSDGRLSMDVMEQDKTIGDDGMEFPQQQEEEDFPMPFEEEETNFHQEEEETAVQFASDMPGMNSPTPSQDSQKSEFSLGAVNDLEADLGDEPRQDQGEDLASSDTKWHKHTVKVLGMLKRNMNTTTQDGDEEDDGKEVQGELSYNKLSYGTSRRTACGVFFELLQLKTWDFIELGQETSYGDIKITPGTRFNEQPPTE
jgi:hypothetical protein